MLRETPMLAIASVLVASLLAGIAPFFFEHGSKQFQGRVTDFVLNPWILAGMTTYLAVMVFFTYAFRLGGTVKVLYPIYATTFIWAALIAVFHQGAPIEWIHVGGMALLLTGIVFMSW
jgi:drug/metabolite transporter (DMT)-like permease